MLAFVVKDGPPRRIACTNEATYTFLWPSFFTSAVPAARPLCRYLARRGAAVHGGLRLVMRDAEDSHHGSSSCPCRLVATRTLHLGTPLISLPLSLSLSAAPDPETSAHSVAGRWEPLEELTGLVVRHLHNPRSPYKRYLEFLHDLYNTDADDEWDGYGERLREQVEELYGGNAVHMQGAMNAPFLEKDALQSTAARVEWVRMQSLVRRVEQSVPHFAAKSVPWGLSMVLARSFRADGGDLSMYPLVDFCAHSATPNTLLRVGTTPEENAQCGVKWHGVHEPCIHLVASRTIAKGDVLTRMFSPHPVASHEDAEWWQVRWGFVPE